MIMAAKVVLYILLSVQALCLVTILLVPFGFDHPSSWGLDYDDFLIVLKIHGIVLLAGIAEACIIRRWLLVGLQVLATMVITILFITKESITG